MSQLLRRSARRKGLTLIEILVVSVIFAIIVTSLFVVFKAGLDSWRRTQAHLEVYQNARAALDMMTRELSAAYLNSTNSSIRFFGFLKDPTVPYPAGWTKNTYGSSVFFVAALNPSLNYSDAVMDLCKVGYHLDGPNKVLMRYSHYNQAGAAPNYDFWDNTNVTFTKIASNVTDLNIVYRNTLGWSLATWDSADASRTDMFNLKPAKVEITLTVKEPNSTKTQTFTTGIYIPQ